MAYLTEEEYLRLTGADEAPEKWATVLVRAGAELDTLTRYFYARHDLETDIPFRRDRFKLALALQVEHFQNTGQMTAEGMNNRPDSVSIGDTTVSYNSTIASSEQSVRSSAVSQDVINVLKGTGLLNRGVTCYDIPLA